MVIDWKYCLGSFWRTHKRLWYAATSKNLHTWWMNNNIPKEHKIGCISRPLQTHKLLVIARLTKSLETIVVSVLLSSSCVFLCFVCRWQRYHIILKVKKNYYCILTLADGNFCVTILLNNEVFTDGKNSTLQSELSLIGENLTLQSELLAK